MASSFRSLLIGLFMVHHGPPLVAQPLIDTASTWNGLVCVMGWCWTETYWFHGDTVVEGITYAKLHRSYSSGPGTEYAGAMREEEDGTIHAIPAHTSQDILVYDLNLDPGETFTGTTFESCTYNTEVSYVDTVTLDDGILRRRTHFQNSQWETWISGIGSTLGLTWMGVGGMDCAPTDMSWTLLCWHHNDSLLYQDPWYGVCSVDHTGITEDPGRGFATVYPVPAQDELLIQWPMLGKIPFAIHATDGTVVRRGLTEGRVYLSGLAPGTYVLMLDTHQGPRHARFVKQ